LVRHLTASPTPAPDTELIDYGLDKLLKTARTSLLRTR
jgi:hypothetical protein